MWIYYRPWCPICEKPEWEQLGADGKFINMIQALEHLEASGHTGIKDRIWNYVADQGSIMNDAITSVSFWGDEDNEQLRADFETFAKAFDLTPDQFGDISFSAEFSW